MKMSRILKVMFIALVVTVLGVSVSNVAAQSGSHTSSQFQGPKANKGTVTHSIKDGKSVLTLKPALQAMNLLNGFGEYDVYSTNQLPN